MYVVMTELEFKALVRDYERDRERDDALLRPDPTAPHLWSVYVQLNHWDTLIPIHLDTDKPTS